MTAEQTPAARARRQATAVAAVAAIVPTILAAQGMTYLAIDLLGFPVLAAIALASFLELALVSSALLARAAALAGRPGGADATAVWVVSATSGLLAAMHELVVTTGGSSTWHIDPGSVLAAAVRAVAPLVAAWLWERVLQAARAEQADRTLAEVRRDRRLLAVARAALVVRRLEGAGRTASRHGRRARRTLDRAHLRALRVAPPAATLADVLAAVGQVDHLPEATRVAPICVRTPDVTVKEDRDARHVRTAVAVLTHPNNQVTASDTAVSALSNADRVHDISEKETVPVRTSAERQPAVAAAQSRPTTLTAHVADEMSPPLSTRVSDETTHNAEEATRDTGEDPDTLTMALAVVRANPSVSGATLASELTRQGRTMSIRSGQRWRTRALNALTHAPHTTEENRQR